MHKDTPTTSLSAADSETHTQKVVGWGGVGWGEEGGRRERSNLERGKERERD